MTKKNKIDVIIAGRNFTVIGDGSKEYIRGLAAYVDERIEDMLNKNDKLSNSMAATLAALNITDELYRTSQELKSLKDEAKGPMEQYSSLVTQLKEAEDKINNLEKECDFYKDELLDTKRKNEEFSRDMGKDKQALELKEKELQKSQSMIKKLQDKVFENQMELIEIKKELEEAIRTYENEKNIFRKEEI